ncbi:hypothetical protein J2Z70_004757 [Paenibacillus silagei]|uniref:Uncharacterized protein n=1 Tax=Paenibacillus silagei TaxID=1670801 RepID=A0ABS4NX03_9BACL|nr:hypothetical protein [Paenibacillus silagei]
MDAPRTDRCSNRCALQIFFIPLSGENPETKATAIAFTQSFRSLRCLSGMRFKTTNQALHTPFRPRTSSCVRFFAYIRTTRLRASKCMLFFAYIRTTYLAPGALWSVFRLHWSRLSRACTLRLWSVFSIHWARLPRASVLWSVFSIHWARLPRASVLWSVFSIHWARLPRASVLWSVFSIHFSHIPRAYQLWSVFSIHLGYLPRAIGFVVGF